MNKETKRDKKRTEILTAAFRLFMEKGFQNTKIVDIAESLNIGKGTIYEYFHSKDDMLLEVIGKYVKEDIAKAASKVDRFSGFEEKLRAFVSFELDFVNKYGQHMLEIKRMTEMPNPQLTEDICRAVLEMIVAEYQIALSIVDCGAEAGRLRDMDRATAAYFIMSMVGSYVAMKGGLPNRLLDTETMPTCFDLSSVKPPEMPFVGYETEDVMNLILRGVGA